MHIKKSALDIHGTFLLEERQQDGTTVKQAVFRFARFRRYVLPGFQ